MRYATLHRFTRHEYERLIEHGLLDEDAPIELLDGLLMVKEPHSSTHRTAVLLVAEMLRRAFGEGWFIPRSWSRSRSRACAWPADARLPSTPARASRTTGS